MLGSVLFFFAGVLLGLTSLAFIALVLLQLSLMVRRVLMRQHTTHREHQRPRHHDNDARQYTLPCGMRKMHLRPHSLACVANVSFGCRDHHSVWVSKGCKAVFQMSTGDNIVCGFHGEDPTQRHACRVPVSREELWETSRIPSLGSREHAGLPACDCQAAGLAKFCEPPMHNDSVACWRGDRGNTVLGPACCAPPTGTSSCEAGWVPCAWRAPDRVAWLHAPKTGTSFLLMLAHLASNRTLPETAQVPSFKRSRTLQSHAFFSRYPIQRYFKGSALIWRPGIEHASISPAAWAQFKGRFFGMFREPRSRGLSAYQFFVNSTSVAHDSNTRRDSVAEGRGEGVIPPREYARCIQGTQAGMLTGQMPTREFGAVGCHLPTADGQCDYEACPPFVPDMSLARVRLSEGFAFVGLLEEWALSACLFAVQFGIRCVPALFANSRPTLGAHAGTRTSMALRDFEDRYDAEVYRWAKERFERDLRVYNVTRRRCAEVCRGTNAFELES